MPDKITKKELELATTINRLEQAAGRPALSGGLLASGVNFLLSKVSRSILSAAIAIYLSFNAYNMFNEAIIKTNTVASKRNDTVKLAAQVAAMKGENETKTRIRQTKLEELNKITADAQAAKAQADALWHVVGDTTARVRQLLAELAEKQAKLDTAKAAAGAATQKINGLPGAFRLKRGEVANLEYEAQRKSADLKLKLKVSRGADASAADIDATVNKYFRSNQE